MVSGDAITPTGILDTGARIIELERLYNLRLGITSAADTLPPRFTEEGVPSGKHRGRICDLQELLDAYFRLRGWPHGDVVLSDKVRRAAVEIS